MLQCHSIMINAQPMFIWKKNIRFFEEKRPNKLCVPKSNGVYISWACQQISLSHYLHLFPCGHVLFKQAWSPMWERIYLIKALYLQFQVHETQVDKGGRIQEFQYIDKLANYFRKQSINSKRKAFPFFGKKSLYKLFLKLFILG